jgi:hypothetical protein
VFLACDVAGKSTLAQQVAARLNLPNVLQTDIICDLLRLSEDSPLCRVPLWERGDLGETQLLGEFQRECAMVRKGIDGDLLKVAGVEPTMEFFSKRKSNHLSCMKKSKQECFSFEKEKEI